MPGEILTKLLHTKNSISLHEDILLFLSYFVWNVRKVSYNQVDISKWVLNNCKHLTELSLSNCTNVDKNNFAEIITRLGPQLESLELDHIILTPKIYSKMGENLKRLIKLKIWNCKFSKRKQINLFFDNLFWNNHKIEHYDLNETLQEFCLPQLNLKTNQAYLDVVEKVYYSFLSNLHYTNLPENFRDTDLVSDLIFHRQRKLKLKKFNKMTANCNKTYKKVNRVLKLLPCLEEADLDIQYLKNWQKKCIINNLNENLTSLSISIYRPISTVLYIGRKLKFITYLLFSFIDERMCCEPNKSFDKLESMDLIVFRHLQTLQVSLLDVIEQTRFLKVLLTILKGCQHTLSTFMIQGGGVTNFSEVIDFICNRKISLHYIMFSFIDHLSDTDIMRLAKLDVKGERSLVIEKCKRITVGGVQAVANYIAENNLGVMFKLCYEPF